MSSAQQALGSVKRKAKAASSRVDVAQEQLADQLAAEAAGTTGAREGSDDEDDSWEDEEAVHAQARNHAAMPAAAASGRSSSSGHPAQAHMDAASRAGCVIDGGLAVSLKTTIEHMDTSTASATVTVSWSITPPASGSEYMFSGTSVPPSRGWTPGESDYIALYLLPLSAARAVAAARCQNPKPSEPALPAATSHGGTTARSITASNLCTAGRHPGRDHWAVDWATGTTTGTTTLKVPAGLLAAGAGDPPRAVAAYVAASDAVAGVSLPLQLRSLHRALDAEEASSLVTVPTVIAVSSGPDVEPVGAPGIARLMTGVSTVEVELALPRRVSRANASSEPAWGMVTAQVETGNRHVLVVAATQAAVARSVPLRILSRVRLPYQLDDGVTVSLSLPKPACPSSSSSVALGLVRASARLRHRGAAVAPQLHPEVFVAPPAELRAMKAGGLSCRMCRQALVRASASPPAVPVSGPRFVAAPAEFAGIGSSLFLCHPSHAPVGGSEESDRHARPGVAVVGPVTVTVAAADLAIPAAVSVDETPARTTSLLRPVQGEGRAATTADSAAGAGAFGPDSAGIASLRTARCSRCRCVLGHASVALGLPFLASRRSSAAPPGVSQASFVLAKHAVSAMRAHTPGGMGDAIAEHSFVTSLAQQFVYCAAEGAGNRWLVRDGPIGSSRTRACLLTLRSWSLLLRLIPATGISSADWSGMEADMRLLVSLRRDWAERFAPVVLVDVDTVAGGPMLARLVSQMSARRSQAAVIDIVVQRWQLRQLDGAVRAAARLLSTVQSSLLSEQAADARPLMTAVLPLPGSWR